MTIIFPATAQVKVDRSKLKKDTNAQEGLGSEFRRIMAMSQGQKKVPIMDTVKMVHLYMKHFELKDDHHLQGISTSYRKKKGDTITEPPKGNHTTRKFVDPKYVNDGVPDLRAATPVSSNKKAYPSRALEQNHETRELTTLHALHSLVRNVGPGRPPGSKNKAPKNDKLFWSAMGFPWGVEKYRPTPDTEFSLSNTCPLDTTLMAWFLINQYQYIPLPEETLATPAGIILEQVVQEIRSPVPDYNKARFLWCTKVMKLVSSGSHCLYSSFNHVFHERVESLFEVIRLQVSQCTNEACPARIKTKQVSKPGWQLHAKLPINQQSFDASLRASVTHLHREDGVSDVACTEQAGSDINLQDLDGEKWRLQSIRDLATLKDDYWAICRGDRIFRRDEFVTLPTIFTIIPGYGRQNCNMPLPATKLRVGNQEYRLAATLFSNGSHFCCTVVVEGKTLLYDGKKRGKCKFVSPKDMAGFRKRFFVAEAWYTKYPRQKEHASRQSQFLETEGPERTIKQSQTELIGEPEQKEQRTQSRSSGRLPELPPSMVLPNPLTKPQSPTQRKMSFDGSALAQTGDFHVTKRVKYIGGRTRTVYPMGFSTQPVSSSGRRPTCQGCGEPVGKGELRLVHRIITRTDQQSGNVFTDASSYHRNVECLDSALRKSHSKGKLTVGELNKATEELYRIDG